MQRRDPEDREDRVGDQGELGVEREQDHGGADQRQRRPEQRDDPVRDQRVERLDVVGEPRDEHAGALARVEADRHALQVREELDPEVLQRPLADPADQVGLRVGRAPIHQRRDEERDDDPRQRRQIARHDPLVDRQRGQRRGRQRRGGREHQRDEHQRDAPAVRAEQHDEAAQLAPAAGRGAPAAHEVVAPRAPAAAPRARRAVRRGLLMLPLSRIAHSPATRSTGSRFRNTWSGRPLVAISAYSGDCESSAS